MEHGVDMLPVVDGWGALRGVVYRGDVVGMLSRTLRPPTVGGMATPLGVYLTTGSISGGAGSFGLYLTGISLGIMMIIAKVLGDRLMAKLDLLSAHAPLAVRRALTSLSATEIISAVISIGIMLMLLRLSPLAGYHAAEHMTVHAIEHGEDLNPEIVRRMPRVHPRCGTNILAALSVFLLITAQFKDSEIAVLIAVLVVILGRKALGDWMQAVFTTKPPSDRQLKNGIAAGDQIIRRYHEHPNRQVYGFARIWNMGFLQAAAGMTTVLYAVYLIGKLFRSCRRCCCRQKLRRSRKSERKRTCR